MSEQIWKDSYFILNTCLDKGVQEFVVCAGARNGPLVEILQKQSHLKIFNFFEERSASFFALGRIRSSGRPVAVVTTSGTAVAETLPAVIEANYQGLPLLIISADRPRSYRGSGSPQAIDQLGFFTNHVAGTWDFESDLKVDASWTNWDLNQPFHLNVCLGEPGAQLQVPVEFQKLNASQDPKAKKVNLPDVDPIVFGKLKNPLVIVGPLSPQERPGVEKFLKEFSGPKIVETLSGLGHLGKPCDPQLLFKQGICQSVLRIGAVPTLRFWRDLEEDYRTLPVYSFVAAENPWSGLSRDSFVIPGLDKLNHILNFIANDGFQSKTNDSGVGHSKTETQSSENLRSENLNSRPGTQSSSSLEQQLVQQLAEKIQNRNLYVGNSLPVRHFDQVAGGLKFKDVFGNRGVNGIDGQISTYLGWTADDADESWCVVGDLTAMYDLAALWVTPQLKTAKRRIVVINNGGGMIFNKFSKHPGFLNRHEIEFSGWAKMWSWSYQKWTQIPQDLSSLPDQVLIELVPRG